MSSMLINFPVRGNMLLWYKFIRLEAYATYSTGFRPSMIRIYMCGIQKAGVK